MAQEIPEGCEKYEILRIVNPGVYWMAKKHTPENYREVMQQLHSLLSKNIGKNASAEEISVGKMIAVKIQTDFHRGIVKDIFNRNSKITYFVLLIDNGNMIEVSRNTVYLIKNQELVNKKSVGVEVSVNGIQPVALDLKSENHFLGGIFHMRVQNNWSEPSYKYVQHLFYENHCVFVKPHQISGIKILGDIYFTNEPDKILINLGQKLCEAGFAVFSEVKSEFSAKADLLGSKDFDIEEKIPLKTNSLVSHSLNSAYQLCKNKTQSTTSNHLANTSIDQDSHRKISVSIKENASNSSSKNTNEVEECTLSSSWILKKHFPISLLHSHHNYLNRSGIYVSEKDCNSDLQNSKNNFRCKGSINPSSN